jgi:hypothetical protein
MNFIDSIPKLAEFTTYSHDGEAWRATIIFPKNMEQTREDRDASRPDGQRITRVDALEAAAMQGYEQRHDETMGNVQLHTPTITSALGIWIVQQTGHANA